jgi:uncharacterized protein YjbJ (UPF0337 family)
MMPTTLLPRHAPARPCRHADHPQRHPSGRNVILSRSFSSCTERSLTKEHNVNWDQIKGKWKQLKGKAREQWGDLTDDDLDKVEGNREQLAGRIQERYGIAKEEAERQVDEWSRRMV